MSSIPYASVPQTFMKVGGLVLRQKAQKGDAVVSALGLPFEARNKYQVNLLPPHTAIKSEPNDPNGWTPTAEELERLDTLFFAHEESSLFDRILLLFLGCGNYQRLKMHLSASGSTGDVYVIDRPQMCGGSVLCPFEMNLDAVVDGNVHRIDRVREDFSPYFSKCVASCCLGTTYSDIERAMPDGTFEKRYSVRSNVWCCGRANNCYGESCLKNDAVYDILDTNGQVVAHMQLTYAGGKGLGACCRVGLDFNYILEFPLDSTVDDCMLLLTALFQVEYQLFEFSE